MMQGIGLRCAGCFNVPYRRTGTSWDVPLEVGAGGQRKRDTRPFLTFSFSAATVMCAV
jgi:hypothetical protein